MWFAGIIATFAIAALNTRITKSFTIASTITFQAQICIALSYTSSTATFLSCGTTRFTAASTITFQAQ